MKVPGILIALMSLVVEVGAIDLSQVNFNYKYNPKSPVKLNYRISQQDRNFELFLKTSYYSNNTDQLTVAVFLQQNFTDTTETVLRGQQLRVYSTGDSFFLSHRYSFSADTSQRLVVIQVNDALSGSNYYYDISIDSKVDFPFPEFVPYVGDTTILFTDYLDDRKRISFRDSTISAYQYSQEYPAADPPMSAKQNGPRNLEIDTVVTVKEALEIDRSKFYFFQKDTSSLSGIGLLAATPLYPKFITLEEILEPLIYISTTKEYEAIAAASNQKAAMDKFFIEVTGEKERAIAVIRRYFERVKEANEMFTNYKEGWKTDMGMVYIILGTPGRVIRSRFKEVWSYQVSGAEELSFTFDKIKNIFTTNHYTLQRDERYSKSWFRQVDLWRKGRI